MSQRRALYDVLIQNGYYLPPLSDPSLTVFKLKKLYKQELICPSNALIKPVQLKCKASTNMLREQILASFNEGGELIWFANGRLPSKSYLIDFLYAFDSENPVLGKSFKLTRSRRKIVNGDCRRCVNSVKKMIRKAKLKQKEEPPRPILAPVGIPFASNLRETARLLFRSRNGWLTIRRARYDGALKPFGIDDPAVQYSVQREIGIIDNLIDQWRQIRVGDAN